MKIKNKNLKKNHSKTLIVIKSILQYLQLLKNSNL